MKKNLLVLVAVAMTLTAVKGQVVESEIKPGVSQPAGSDFKAEKGQFILEAGFSPFEAEGNSINLQKGQIRATYMASDRIGIRLGLGLSSFSQNDDNGKTAEEWSSSTDKASMVSFSPGIAYYFDGAERLAPYVGVEVTISTVSTTSITEARDFKQITYNEGGLFNQFGGALLGGFNYYFAKHLFAGAEIGLGFESNSLKNPVIETTEEGKTATVEPKNKVDQFSIGTRFNPSIRLGWVF
ncbi:MAG: outer membrane beta-barrel protein [Tannerella sp.]|jgi:outer membrane protein W|nr:outer membrane beta-barrel protein [Tannerella sp.]